jgi:hypothetical protein
MTDEVKVIRFHDFVKPDKKADDATRQELHRRATRRGIWRRKRREPKTDN